VRFDLYTDATLSRDFPEHRLCRGGVVKIVGHHRSTNGESGYSIEVFNTVGNTIVVTAVPQSALEAPAACFWSSLLRRRSHSLARRSLGERWSPLLNFLILLLPFSVAAR